MRSPVLRTAPTGNYSKMLRRFSLFLFSFCEYSTNKLSRSFFVIPVAHFPWSDMGRERRQKVNNDVARDASALA
jgi:hypothetical protein